MTRVMSHIDDFNLYHGLRDASLHSSRWLDLVRLSQALLKEHQHLQMVRYFTARVRGNPATERRQSTYLEALDAKGGVDITYGHFLSKRIECHSCGQSWHTHEEKKTDVNIAVQILNDAYDDIYDVALLVSGDSDLAPPVASVLSRFPDKRVVVAFPPRRNSSELRKTASAALTISKHVIRSSRLPSPITSRSGRQLHAPAGWLPTT